MPDAIGQEEGEAPRGLGEVVALGLLECLSEGLELIPVFLVFASGIFFLYLVGSGTYHFAFDPDAANVAARLDALSIDPAKWIGRA